MRALGFERFRVVGHDRGGRVAYRLALDHPQAVERLAVLDIVPTVEAWEVMDAQKAVQMFHWTFLVWGERGTIAKSEPLRIWRTWAEDVRGHSLPCGHLLPEEASAGVVAALQEFMNG